MAYEFEMQDEFDRLKAFVSTAAGKVLIKIAAKVRREAIASMPFKPGKADPNEPPHSHKGDLRRSIGYIVESDELVRVGPRESFVGERGAVLEFAGTFIEGGRDQRGRFKRGRQSAKAPSGAKWAHPFMLPARDKAIETFAGTVTGSFGES